MTELLPEKITKCQYSSCDVEFGRIANKKQMCICCHKVFCDAHACEYKLIEHLLGNHLPNIEEVCHKKGYICQDCLASDGLSLPMYQKAFFSRKCAYPRCNKSVDTLISSLNSCVACGNLFCEEHAKHKKLEMSADWQNKYINYPEPNKVCLNCLQTKPANVEEKILQNHAKTSLLKLMAGEPDGKRVAIVVHGMMSHYKNMSNFCDALYSKGVFDTIWCLNDYSYQGRVAEAKTFSPKDIASFNLPKAILGKLMSIGDLPAYIIEGAAQLLHLLITQLEMKNVTLIGHSLGGLVVRCTAETYDLSSYVNNIVTLASPHRLWLKTHGLKLRKWTPEPNQKIKYLALLGKGDMVAVNTDVSNLTASDTELSNVYKVLLKGNHTNIHDCPHGKYIPELIAGFLNDFSGFYVVSKPEDKSISHYIRYAKLHQDVLEKQAVITGEWMEFTAGKLVSL